MIRASASSRGVGYAAVFVVALAIAAVAVAPCAKADTSTNHVSCRFWLFGVSDRAAKYFPTIGTGEPKAVLSRFTSMVARHEAQLIASTSVTAISGGDASYLIGGQLPRASDEDPGRVEFVDYGFDDRCMPKIDASGAIAAKFVVTYDVPVRGAPLRTYSTEQFTIDIRGTKATTLVHRYVDGNWPSRPEATKQPASPFATVATIVVLEPAPFTAPPSATPSPGVEPAPSPSNA